MAGRKERRRTEHRQWLCRYAFDSARKYWVTSRQHLPPPAWPFTHHPRPSQRLPQNSGWMNYLAHLLLADYSDDALLGAMLGDFVAGAALGDWPDAVQREIRIHRWIDGYTDRHPEVLGLKANFPQGQRRYAGILLDVYFDHLLARDWPLHADQALDAFSQRVYAALRTHQATLPPRLAAMAPLMAAGDWLSSYRHREAVDRAVGGIARRLARGDLLLACLPTLRAHEGAAQAAFARFFPELRAFVTSRREAA